MLSRQDSIFFQPYDKLTGNVTLVLPTTAAGVNTFVHTSGQIFQITEKIIWLVSWRGLLPGTLIFISHDANELNRQQYEGE